ncbi:hypothetical protein EV655_12224 [Rhodovulum euryhalinum]|uniref:Uncharacterized protein n=1 Tax=Rhodovulum euryhalinum TaxID=35805 RepID=A0A4R2KET3_9RHOB|nr:hypothetical protein [Rhodovulum euryhalinum]TCO68846.1 hypothetical protein EV655_12224 [Rhodovulum euryhalinum]
MSEILTKSRARNIFYGGSLAFKAIRDQLEGHPLAQLPDVSAGLGYMPFQPVLRWV